MVEAYFTEQHELIRDGHDFAEKELTKEVLDQVEGDGGVSGGNSG